MEAAQFGVVGAGRGGVSGPGCGSGFVLVRATGGSAPGGLGESRRTTVGGVTSAVWGEAVDVGGRDRGSGRTAGFWAARVTAPVVEAAQIGPVVVVVGFGRWSGVVLARAEGAGGEGDAVDGGIFPAAASRSRNAWMSGGRTPALGAAAAAPGTTSLAGPRAGLDPGPDGRDVRAGTAPERPARALAGVRSTSSGALASSVASRLRTIAPGLVPGPAAVTPRRVATIGSPRRMTARRSAGRPGRAGLTGAVG
ncbi:MAG: hypothetical protein ABW328_20370 [Ilumatobacteraceae bacterium]